MKLIKTITLKKAQMTHMPMEKRKTLHFKKMKLKSKKKKKK